MYSYIALFKGMNVGGHHIIRMKDLKTIFEMEGCESVSTYIQSGNVIFQKSDPLSSAFVQTIQSAIERQFGFLSDLLLLPENAFKIAIENNPFDPDGGKNVHFFFVKTTPESVEWEAISAIKKETEAFQMIDTVFYLNAPEGIGKSKLASKIGQLLGVSVTARNLNTVQKLRSILQKMSLNIDT